MIIELPAYIRSDRSEEYISLFLILLVLLISPVLALIISGYRLIKTEKNEIWTYYSFFICMALWLGAINATKVPASDQLAYLSIFNNVPEKGFYNTIFKVWGSFGKDPAYGLITYISYYLCWGNSHLFFCLLTFVMYIFHFIAVYKLFTKMNAGKGAIICGVLALAFFSQYFNLTVHLIRQMLAEAIIIYAIASKCTDGKNRWGYLIIGYLIHSSTGLLIVLSLIPILYKKLSFIQISLILICFMPIVLFNEQVGMFLGGMTSGIDSLSYSINRFTSNALDGSRNLPLSLMLTVLCPLCYIGIKKLFFDNDIRDEIRPMIHIYFLLMLFVLSFYKNPLMQYRFFYYTYSFIPFLLPLLIKKTNTYANIFYIGLSCFFIIRFFVLYDKMVWQYASLLDVLLLPFPYLLTYPYF